MLFVNSQNDKMRLWDSFYKSGVLNKVVYLSTSILSLWSPQCHRRVMSCCQLTSSHSADLKTALPSSADLSVLGCAEVSLLRSDSGSVCQRGQSWLQFCCWATGGSSEAQQGSAVETPERNSAVSGWVCSSRPHQPASHQMFDLSAVMSSVCRRAL